MELELREICQEELPAFKKEMQEAFWQGAGACLGEKEDVLPESHIDRSLKTPGAYALEGVVVGERAGGAIAVIDETTGRSHLDFLYVNPFFQDKGVGLALWKALEARFPQTKVWETCTPYFEKRNIHFYVNKCGFQIVEFFCSSHPDPQDLDLLEEGIEEGQEMFRFEKRMETNSTS